ncbi:hypothetical protein HYC85_017199 [Camellia sinensis]|uniref:Reverse transcriptase RNase H-like domain-containing protein n=1 Tax=Camellia sinensis TaxID=4442 RepID=A0A7J7H406_CAMSI|nr:hypothetical protein HYC85_017199 [Camellia sinensis]
MRHTNSISTNLSSFAMKTHNDDEIDAEDGKLEKGKEKTIRSNKTVKIHNRALVSGLAYCISSCSMILVNKYVLSSYDFNAGISLMFYQNLVSVVVVSLLSFFGVITTEPLTWRLIKVWFPVNAIFVGMLITSMFRWEVTLVEMKRFRSVVAYFSEKVNKAQSRYSTYELKFYAIVQASKHRRNYLIHREFVLNSDFEALKIFTFTEKSDVFLSFFSAFSSPLFLHHRFIAATAAACLLLYCGCRLLPSLVDAT